MASVAAFPASPASGFTKGQNLHIDGGYMEHVACLGVLTMNDYKDRWTIVRVNVEDGVAWITLNRPEKRNAMRPRYDKTIKPGLDTYQR